MDMRTASNGFDRFAYRPAIFNDLFVLGQIAHGDFVAERDVIPQFDAARASWMTILCGIGLTGSLVAGPAKFGFSLSAPHPVASDN